MPAALAILGMASPMAAQERASDSFPIAPSLQGTAAAGLIERHVAADQALRESRFQDAKTLFLGLLRDDPGSATLNYGLACASAGLRQKEAGLSLLRRAKALGFRDSAMANRDSDLFQIRFDRRFSEIFPRLNVPEDDTRAQRWRFAGSPSGAIAQPHEGDWLAVAPALGRVRILELSTGVERHVLAPAAAPAAALAASPEGDLLASLDVDGQLSLIDPHAGTSMPASAAPDIDGDGWPARLVFAAEGERILASTSSGLAIWKRAGEFLGVLRPAGKGGRSAWRLSPSSQGSSMGPWAIEVDARRVHLHDVTADEPSVRTLEFEEEVRAAALSRDGALMAVGTKFGGLHLVDPASGATLWRATVTSYLSGSTTDLFGSPVSVSTLAFDPAARRLAICTTSGYLVSVFDVASGERLWRSGHLGGRMGTAMPLLLGHELLVGDSGGFLWNAATGKELIRRPPGSTAIGLTAQSALLVRSGNGLELLEAPTAKRRWRCDLSQGPAGQIEHPSGWVGGAPDPFCHDPDPQRFDPKRIRAAFTGLALLPAPARRPGWKLYAAGADYLTLAHAAERLFSQVVPTAGMRAPEIRGEDFEGNPMRLSDFLGKVTVLEFTRCSNPLSRPRAAAAERLLAKHASEPLAWVTVLSDTKDSYRESIGQGGAPWPSFYDGGSTHGPLSTAWGVTSWPTIFVIDHEGVLRHRGVASTRLESVVRTLLKAAQGG